MSKTIGSTFWTRLGKTLDRVERKATARYGDETCVPTSYVPRFWDIALSFDRLRDREQRLGRGYRLAVRNGNSGRRLWETPQ